MSLFLALNSSFSDKPINEAATGPIGRELFEKEQDDLLADLKDIPKKACDRRVSVHLSSFIPSPLIGCNHIFSV